MSEMEKPRSSAGDGTGQSAPSDPRRLRLRVTGMHCKGCASTIEAALRVRPGVLRARIDYKAREGTVFYDPSVTNPDRITSDEILREPSPFEAAVLGDEEA